MQVKCQPHIHLYNKVSSTVVIGNTLILNFMQDICNLVVIHVFSAIKERLSLS